jgi:hypothetical protein
MMKITRGPRGLKRLLVEKEMQNVGPYPSRYPSSNNDTDTSLLRLASLLLLRLRLTFDPRVQKV